MSDDDGSAVDRWLGTTDPPPRDSGLPSQTKWAVAHPVLLGILTGAVMFLLGWLRGFWLSVNIAVGLSVGLLNWFLWTLHGGPLRKRYGPPLDTDPVSKAERVAMSGPPELPLGVQW